MRISLFITCIILVLSGLNCLFAQQATFVRAGTIEFEKTVNTHAIIRKELNKGNVSALTAAQYDAYKQTYPQFKVMQSILRFSDDQSLFIPITLVEPANPLNGHPALQQMNIVFRENNKIIIQKHIFNEVFLLKDTLKKISWKITNETRDICGYACRRANAIIMDSIYVVAFYTDKILMEAGPESFYGLPGMILGVVLPHENITWFAKKVATEVHLPITAPDKGELIDEKNLRVKLETSTIYDIKSYLNLLLL